MVDLQIIGMSCKQVIKVDTQIAQLGTVAKSIKVLQS